MTVGATALAAIGAALLVMRSAPPDQAWKEQLHAARIARDQGRSDAAVQHFAAALREATATFRADDPRLDLTVHEFARLRVARGEPREAESLYLFLLGYRDPLGENHPAVARALDELGGYYRDQERYRPAESAYRRALRIRERVFGRDHPEVVTSLLSLAELYRLTGVAPAAAELCERALEIRHSSTGPALLDTRRLSTVCRTEETSGSR